MESPLFHVLMLIREEDGNFHPGATRVAMEAVQKYGGDAVVLFEKLYITPVEIWRLFSICCDESIETFASVINDDEVIKLLQTVPGSQYYKEVE